MIRNVFISIFIIMAMPLLTSMAWASPDIIKEKYNGNSSGHRHSSVAPSGNNGPVTIDTDNGKRTIYIMFGQPTDNAEIKIYCNGNLSINDKETATKFTVIEYTLTGNEQTDCTVIVKTNGQTQAMECVTIK